MARGSILIVAVSAAVGVAAPAQAATVTATERLDAFGLHTDVSVVAGAGERNQVTVDYPQEGTRVRDSVPLQAGAGCALQQDGSVICAGDPWMLDVDAGDLDDRVEVGDGGVQRMLFGGAGNDTLAPQGDRMTELTGGVGDDRMVGGAGVDIFREGPVANGSDTMIGDARDIVSYRQRTENVHADLAGDADDGEAGEQDRIGTGIHAVEGGKGHDFLAGGTGEDLLRGFGGSDMLAGGGGDDEILGGLMRTGETTNDRLRGGYGSDDLHGGGGPDLLRGGPGRDRLFGRYGRDVLYGGPGRDAMSAGPGNDRLRALDGLAEQLDCGGGWDRVRHDVFDSLARDCERHGPTRRPPTA
jgi:Ca2+-binding RTX toxin-like protein